MATTREKPELLTIGKERFGTTLVLRLAGELDLSSGDTLGEALRDDADAQSVILDLELLEFVDSAGLRSIYQLWEVSRNDGFNLAIIGATGPVRRVMDLTGLDQVLPLVDESGPAA